MFITYGRGKNSRYGTIFLDKMQANVLGGIGAKVDIEINTKSSPNTLKIKKGTRRRIIRAYGSVYARINVDDGLPVMKRQHFFESPLPVLAGTLIFNIPNTHRDGVSMKRGSFVRDTSKLDQLPMDDDRVPLDAVGAPEPLEAPEAIAAKELYAFATRVKEAYDNFLDIAIQRGFNVTFTNPQEDPLMVNIKVEKQITIQEPLAHVVKLSMEID